MVNDPIGLGLKNLEISLETSSEPQKEKRHYLYGSHSYERKKFKDFQGPQICFFENLKYIPRGHNLAIPKCHSCFTQTAK